MTEAQGDFFYLLLVFLLSLTTASGLALNAYGLLRDRSGPWVLDAWRFGFLVIACVPIALTQALGWWMGTVILALYVLGYLRENYLKDLAAERLEQKGDPRILQ